MLYREIIAAVCSQIHTKHINTLCGQKVEVLNVRLGYIFWPLSRHVRGWMQQIPYSNVYCCLGWGVWCACQGRTMCRWRCKCLVQLTHVFPNALSVHCVCVCVCVCTRLRPKIEAFLCGTCALHLQGTQHGELLGLPDCVISETTQRLSMKFGSYLGHYKSFLQFPLSSVKSEAYCASS